MKLLALTAGTMLATAATFASADYYGRDARVDPYYTPGVPAHQECWNPSAGHYETVRGGPQGDLDFRNCRVVRDDGYAEAPPVYSAPPVYAAPPAYAAAPAYRGRQECWNPGAGHYEEVRGGYQGDLDYSRCRMIGGDDRYAPAWRGARQECWNPRAGHYEEVRGGYQGDLDYRRCRLIG